MSMLSDKQLVERHDKAMKVVCRRTKERRETNRNIAAQQIPEQIGSPNGFAHGIYKLHFLDYRVANGPVLPKFTEHARLVILSAHTYIVAGQIAVPVLLMFR